MRLSELRVGSKGVVIKILGHSGFVHRITETGILPGVKVEPAEAQGDTLTFRIHDSSCIIDRADAEMVVISELSNSDVSDGYCQANDATRLRNHIDIALIGNPKSGKSALRKRISGKETDEDSSIVAFKDYELHISELAGVFSLSSKNEAELSVRQYLRTHNPDIVLDVADATNLEDSLYLATELLEMNLRTVVALTKYDTLENNGSVLDYEMLGRMVGVPMVPTNGSINEGKDNLLDTIVRVYEGIDESVRHVHISGGIIEKSIVPIKELMKLNLRELPKNYPPRYYATKLLEEDPMVISELQSAPHYQQWEACAAREREHLRSDIREHESIGETLSNQKRGFILGALKETLTSKSGEHRIIAHYIDELVTHRVLGYPIFFLAVWLIFFCTFSLGAYPGEWIEYIVGLIEKGVVLWMPDGMLKDMIVDGVIGGVGSVIVFLPNIMILYLFISFMEDSGYLARAAFLMDRPMHGIGLHGKSFIPLIMGFGCNVPAIMATRSIESHSSRIITIMIVPFMSCSARLPIFVLLAGTFFGVHSGTVMFGLYFIGIIIAMLTAKILRLTLFKKDETPFVMELPSYRLPTFHATITHMWEKCSEYLKKMGGLILVSSIIVWALCYFPAQKPNETKVQHYENSYIGKIGKFCEPAFTPIGLNWKASVSLLSGITAKEIMVSTIGVLYTDIGSTVGDSVTEEISENTSLLSERLAKSGDFSFASVLALLVFTMLYFPCIATLGAVSAEANWKWACFSAVYNTFIAWLLAWITYTIANLF